MTVDEVAEYLEIKPESVRALLRRHGIKPRRGYLRAEVENLRRQQGRRTDLHQEDRR